MSNYNQRYAFVTSVPMDHTQGWGTATAVMGLIEALDRKGKQVALVTPSTPIGPRLWRRWWFNIHVTRSLRDLDVDAVIGIDCDGYKFAQSPGRSPYVVFLHGVKADEVAYASGLERRRLACEARWEQQACHASKLVVTPSEYSRQRAAELYGISLSKISVVHNGLDLDQWPRQPFHDNPSPVLFSSANFTTRKGLPTLLKAWKIVSEAHPGVTFRLAGDGPERESLISLTRALWGPDAPVTFSGLLRTPQLRAEYAACDVFCLPSRQEAFGMVFLEAMATGRPVVGTDTSALPEIIGTGGIRVPPDRPDMLAEALMELIASPGLREEWGSRARAQAEQFSWDRSAQQFGELLSAL
jgi:glycosyltransferase involved in cell wall biosynthesis